MSARIPRTEGWLPLVAALIATLASVAPASAPAAEEPAEDRIAAFLQKKRAESGAAPLERRAALDAVALDRAQRIGAMPHSKRLSLGESIESRLRQSGVGVFRRASLHMDMNRGYPDPGGAFMRNWLEYEMAWTKAMDPGYNAMGLAMHRADDEWIIFVAVFLEDLPVFDNLRELEWNTIEAVNEVRRVRGLSRLTELEPLGGVARAHSEDMARRGYFRHVSPRGKQAADRVTSAGIRFRALAENIQMSRGYEDPVRKAVDSWLDSPGHREAMLTPEFAETGVGIAVAEDGTLYFTQLFILRREPAPQTEATDEP